MITLIHIFYVFLNCFLLSCPNINVHTFLLLQLWGNRALMLHRGWSSVSHAEGNTQENKDPVLGISRIWPALVMAATQMLSGHYTQSEALLSKKDNSGWIAFLSSSNTDSSITIAHCKECTGKISIMSLMLEYTNCDWSVLNEGTFCMSFNKLQLMMQMFTGHKHSFKTADDFCSAVSKSYHIILLFSTLMCNCAIC